MNIAVVLEWKFPGVEGIVCREIDGEIRVTEFPGALPTPEQLAQWTTEYQAHVALRDIAKAADDERVAAIKATAEAIDILDKLERASADDLRNYVETNVTSLAGARPVLYRVLLALSLLAKEVRK